MTEDQAKTIINEFNSGVDETQRIFYDADPTENISIAEGIINDAAEAFREGMRGEFVTTILSLSESFTSNNNTEDPYIIRRLAEAKIAKEKLPIPPEIDGTPPDLPRDISVLSDSQLRRFHSEFHALLIRSPATIRLWFFVT
jgi:hypothetical protein